MPATVRFVKDKWRVVEADTGHIVKNNAGTAVDGGGHNTRAQALKQARALNSK